jgi:hypothetical protein
MSLPVKLCKHLAFVAAMMAGAHRGLRRIGKSEHDGGAGCVHGAVLKDPAKQSARRGKRREWADRLMG